jgi:broad specificity phosphatase PhoE
VSARDVSGAPARAGGDRKIVLVRHAETEWSRDGKHTGRTDIPLTDAGRASAAALSARMREWRFAAVLVSPLARARETCQLCGLGAEAQERPDLMEWDYGDYEGLTSAQIRARRPRWSLWRDGCPGGETAAQVGARADRTIAELADVAGDAAVFSHGHMLRVLGARWAQLDAALGERLALSTAAICLLGYEHDGQVLWRWNDTGAG